MQSRGARRPLLPLGLLAVVQSLLLISSLVLVPAFALAQEDAAGPEVTAQEPADPGPDATPEPASEATQAGEPSQLAEPAAEPEAAPAEAPAQPLAARDSDKEARQPDRKADGDQAEPEAAPSEPEAAPAEAPAQQPAEKQPDKEARQPDRKADGDQAEPQVGVEPQPKPQPEPKADPKPQPEPKADPKPQPQPELFIHPDGLVLVAGENARLSAWSCDAANGGAPRGADGEPGTADDACSRALGVEWSLSDDAVASFREAEGNTVRLTADTATAGTKIIATVDELKARADLTIDSAPESEPAEPRAEEPPVLEPPAENQGSSHEGGKRDAEPPVAHKPSFDPDPEDPIGPGEFAPQPNADDPATEQSSDPMAEPLAVSTGDLPIQPAANAFSVTPASQSVVAGSTRDFSWAFTATNSGNMATLTFTIPAGWTVPSTGAGAGQVVVAAGSCNASLQSIAGQVVTISQGGGNGCNINQTFTLSYLQATAPTPAPLPQTYTFVTNVTAAPTVTVTAPSADVSITKDDGATIVTAGDGVTRTFTMTVTNAGPSAATAVTLTDTWPAGYTRGTIAPPVGASCADVGGGPSFSCSLGTLAPGASATVTVAYSVPASTPAGSVTNTATVSTTSVDPNPANNSASDTNTVATSADLSVTKTDSPDPVAAGAQLTYTLVVSNAGPSDAQSVSLSDTLPAALGSIVIVDDGPYTCAIVDQDLTCTIGTHPVGVDATIIVTAVVAPASTAGAIITNTATVSSATTDPDLTDNSATATTTVAASADLSVTKNDGVTTVTAGDGVTRTFTITVTNAGPSDATTVQLFDTWPAGYALGAIAPSQGSCQTSTSPPPTVIACTLGTIAAGAGATVTIDYTVPASTPAGTQTNEAEATGNIDDPNALNNTAIDENTVVTSADLSVAKTVDLPETVSGSTVTYTLVVSNNGPSDAANVTLSDTFPPTLQNVTVIDDGPYTCGLVGNVLSCTIASHPVGVNATITVTAQVVPGSYPDQTLVSNTASVSSATPDPDPTDNSSTATFDVRSVDLTVTKATAGGEAGAFEVTVTDASAAVVASGQLANGDSLSLLNAVPGTYTITETLPAAPFRVRGISCSDGTSSSTNTIDVTPAPGTPVTCIITNGTFDLSITKTADVATITAGDPADVVTWTLTVTNDGSSDATEDAVVTDVLPAGLVWSAGSVVAPAGVDCAYNGQALECTIPADQLQAGASVVISAEAFAPADTAPGTYQNAVVVNSPEDPDCTAGGCAQPPECSIPNGGVNPTNGVAGNAGCAGVDVDVLADLAIVKTVSPTETVSGGTVTYTLLVSNTGPSDAQTVTLSDTFPATLQNVTVTTPGPAPYSCGVTGNTLTCTIGTHPAGVNATITATATVVPGTYADPTAVVNMASVSSKTPDPNAGNDAASATFRIRGNAAIRLTKTATPASLPEPGGLVTFKVLIENTSPASAVTISSLVDSVHGNLAGKGDCTVPQAIAVGASYSCSFSAEVNGNAGFVERNVVTATGRDAGSNPLTAADDATVTITDVLPRIAVTKTPSPNQLRAPGGDVTYTITIRNLVLEPLTILAISDDKLGDVGSAANALVTDDSCAKAVGFSLPVGATAQCAFTAPLEGEAGDTHVNTVTVTVSDDDQVLQPAAARVQPAAVNVVTASATATVTFIEGEAAGGEGGEQGGGQPPTDMLVTTDTLSAGRSPLDGPVSWAIWALLTATLIVSGAWVIRRQRLTGM